MEITPGPKSRAIRADSIRSKPVVFGKQQNANNGDYHNQEELVWDPAFANQARADDKYPQNGDDINPLVEEAEHKRNWNLQYDLAGEWCSNHWN